MSKIAASHGFQHDRTAFSRGRELADFSPAERAVIVDCLDKRRDDAPILPEYWPAALGASTLEWTGFAMTAGRLKFRTATSLGPPAGLFRARKRVHWVFAGDADTEFPDRPLSCHCSLAFAAEMLMIFYAGLCAL